MTEVLEMSARIQRSVDVAQARMTVQAAKRRKIALRMKDAGMTYRQIGEEMGVSRQRAYQMVAKARGADAKVVAGKMGA